MDDVDEDDDEEDVLFCRLELLACCWLRRRLQPVSISVIFERLAK